MVEAFCCLDYFCSPVFDVPDRGHPVLIEFGFVGDEQDAAFKGDEGAFELFFGVYVQMVGRFVQYQPVYVAQHQFAQAHFGGFAAAQNKNLAGDMLIGQPAAS